MKKLIIVLLILGASSASAEFSWWFNAGIKIGWNFERNGFHLGPEISMVKEFDYSDLNQSGQFRSANSIGGAYLNIDFFLDGRVVINPGVEFQVIPYPGLCLGPSILIKNDSLFAGINIAIYSGFIFYPYFSYSWYPDYKSIFDSGTFIKYPFGNNIPSLKL